MVNRLVDFFPEISDFDRELLSSAAVEKPTIMLAITARTGSTHLCSMLGRMLGVPNPEEILNPRGVVQWLKEKRGVNNFRDYIKSLSGSPGDFFVFKTNWFDFSCFSDNFLEVFPNLKIIYLDRLNVEAQAVSLYKASVSGKWHQERTAGKALDQSQLGGLADKYNLEALCEIIASLEFEKAAWHRFFFDHKLYPVRINYEDFAENTTASLEYIAKWLDISLPCSLDAQSVYVKSSDNINDLWLDKLRFYRYGKFYSNIKNKAG